MYVKLMTDFLMIYNPFMNHIQKVIEPTQIDIIQLSATKWQQYKSLRLRALKEDPQAFGSSYKKELQYSDKKWQSRLTGGDLIIFANLDQQLVGMAGAYQTDADQKSQSSTIFGVFVVSEARGKGVSRKIMKALLRLLKDRGVAQVNLTVNKDQLAAIGLYRKLGFQVIREKKVVLGDGLEHAEIVMTKRLP